MSIVIGTDLGEQIITGPQDDAIFAPGGDETINAGAGDDLVFGFGGDDTVFGGSGNDVIFGGPGDDTISGGLGDDQLFGGAGSDTLTGGEGEDLFAFNFTDFTEGLPLDEITDFTAGEDTILIQGVGADATVAYDSETGIVSVNGEAFIQLDPGLSIDNNDDFLIT